MVSKDLCKIVFKNRLLCVFIGFAHKFARSMFVYCGKFTRAHHQLGGYFLFEEVLNALRPNSLGRSKHFPEILLFSEGELHW